ALQPTAPEEAMVFEAMSRLRKLHDPAGAGRLIEDYLARFPDGALVEEAEFLAIEASVDPAHAAAAARRYLDRFPAGRYRAAAGRGRPVAVAVGDSCVYWVDTLGPGAGVYRAGRGGAGVTRLASVHPFAHPNWDLLLDEDRAYYTEPGQPVAHFTLPNHEGVA